jgi:hypothetical protein
MTHNKSLVTQALRLRTQGLSIGEIAAKINAPKTTISYWCKNVNLSSAAIQHIAARRRSKTTASLLTYAELQRAARHEREHAAQRNAQHDVGALSARDIFMLGLGLYWGEGYKTSNGECGFSNSDPAMLGVYIHFLHSTFGVEKKDLIARISINETHQSRERSVSAFWVKKLGLQRRQFTKTSFIHAASKKTFPNPEKHFGVLRIKIRKGKKYKDYILGALSAVAHILT